MSDKSTSNNIIGFTSLLLLAFIILKLCKVIDWSCWWVLSPFWITAGLAIVAISIYCLWLILFKEPDEKRRIKSGMSEWAWKHRKDLRPGPEPKSKWQEKLEEMQKKNK